MKNMINDAKRRTVEMSKKSTSKQSENEGNQTKKQPKHSSIIDDLLGNKLNFTFDEDTLLLGAIIYFLYKQNADKKLLIALIYVMFF